MLNSETLKTKTQSFKERMQSEIERKIPLIRRFCLDDLIAVSYRAGFTDGFDDAIKTYGYQKKAQ